MFLILLRYPEYIVHFPYYSRHPQLMRKTLILYANWFTNAIVYYGLALNSGGLSGTDDFFLNYMVKFKLK